MMHAEIDKEKKLSFLWRTSQIYAVQCPQLAAHFMSRFIVLGKKSVPPNLLTSCCTHCSTPHTPHTSAQHTVSRRTLKAKRRKAKGGDISSVHNSIPKSSHHILVNCKVCGVSYVNGALVGTSEQNATPQPSVGTPNAQNVTPQSSLGTPNVKKNKRRRSSMLKSLLLENSQTKRATKSPRLTEFLSTV